MARIGVEILGDATSLNRAFLSAEKGAARFQSRITKANEATRGALSGSGLGRTSLLFGSTAFLGGAVAGGALAKTIGAAADLQKQIEKTDQVFGQSSETIKNWSKTTADSLGISEQQSLKAAASFGNLFDKIGVSTPVAGEMSKRLVALASDLASFNDVSPDQTLKALLSGLVGNTRALKQFQIPLSQAAVNQQALADTGKKSVASLTEQEKVIARYELLIRETANEQGNFAKHAQDLSEQVKIAKANLSDLTDEIGTHTLPTFVLLIQDVNLLDKGFKQLQSIKLPPGLKQLQDLSKGSGGGGLLGKAFTLSPLGALVHPIDNLNEKLKLLRAGLKLVEGSNDSAATSTRKLGDEMHETSQSAQTLVNSLKSASQTAAGLSFKSLKLEANNAPLDQRIALQKQIIANDKKIVLGSDSGSKARRQALQQQIADQNQLAALQSQVTQKQADAQAKIDKKRQDAITAESNRISRIFQAFDLKLSKAQLTPGLQDDLKALNAELQTVLKLTKTHKDNLDLQQREVDLRGQILDLQKQQADAQKQALQDAKDQAKSLFGNLFQSAADQAQRAFLGGSRGKKTIALPSDGGTPTTPQELLAAAKAQNNSFAQLIRDIGILAKRGAPASLITAAKSGQISAAQVDALAKASPKVLERIFGQVRRADKLIASATKMELRANTVTVNAKSLNLAGLGDRGTSGGITVHGNIVVNGVQDSKKLAQQITRDAKKRANQRRGRVGGTR